MAKATKAKTKAKAPDKIETGQVWFTKDGSYFTVIGRVSAIDAQRFCYDRGPQRSGGYSSSVGLKPFQDAVKAGKIIYVGKVDVVENP